MKASNQFLEAILEGLTAQRTRIDAQIAEVRLMLGKRRPGRPPAQVVSAVAEAPHRKRRKLGAAARKRIAAAQRKRWAAFRAAKTT